MLNLSYTISPKIKNSIYNIDSLRKRILTFPLPQKIELQLKWEAEVARIYWSLTISGNNTKKKNIARLISSLSPSISKLTNDEKEVLRYKEVLDYIYNNWYVRDEKLSCGDILKLYNILSRTRSSITASKNSELEKVLEYLEMSDEHPVIKAGIFQIEIRSISPFPSYNGMMSRLAGYLILYKNGYDFRRMLILDEYWHKENAKYKTAIEMSAQKQNLTTWLEFYTGAVELELNKTMQILYAKRTQSLIPEKFWSLNERQKEIIGYLLNPENKITNREVQNKFGVSQITASRDLIKLVKLGIAVSRGRGRSTFYTGA